jgi:hypothetical protein
MLTCYLQLFVGFGSHKLEDKHSYITTHSIHFLQFAFNCFWCLQVIFPSLSHFVVIKLFLPSSYLMLFYLFSWQRRDWKMGCFSCCCIKAFYSKAFPWYVTILLKLNHVILVSQHNWKSSIASTIYWESALVASICPYKRVRFNIEHTLITRHDCYCRLVGVARCFDTFDCCIS